MRYGMPYKGSKNQIAQWVISHIPACEYLYDVFGGGGAITHCAVESEKFEHVIYNEFNPLVHKAFNMAVHGKFKNERRWISHEDFIKLKDSDPYAAFCFSFGNNLKDYCYSKAIEPYKKASHYAVCFGDFSEGEKLGLDLSFIKGETIRERRRSLDNDLPDHYPELKTLLKFPKRKCDNKQLIHLEALQRLQSLERLESLERLDYKELRFKDHSVIYCDPPYVNTTGYKVNFDHEVFYSWCEQQKQLVIISEYQMPDDRFSEIARKEKRSLMNSDKSKTVIKQECLFIPIKQKDLYLKMISSNFLRG